MENYGSSSTDEYTVSSLATTTKWNEAGFYLWNELRQVKIRHDFFPSSFWFAGCYLLQSRYYWEDRSSMVDSLLEALSPIYWPEPCWVERSGSLGWCLFFPPILCGLRLLFRLSSFCLSSWVSSLFKWPACLIYRASCRTETVASVPATYQSSRKTNISSFFLKLWTAITFRWPV